jgi:hypothetical protein
VNGEYAFWLFGNDSCSADADTRYPCYQTQYGGSNAFAAFIVKGGRVTVSQVLDGYFSRADNSVTCFRETRQRRDYRSRNRFRWT